MTTLALLAMFAAVTAGALWVVFPSPLTFTAAIAALGAMWLIEYAVCARQIRRVQAAGGTVNYVALRCVGYATTMTGIVVVCIVAVRVVFALFVEAPAP